jgi:hypothetical protein
MDSGVLGLAAVTWNDAWNATASESGLRLPVEPARLLELLRGLPVARALLADLQRAVSTGRSVELIVSPDHQVAEIATGSGHHVLTQAARNAVLAALLVRSQAPASSREGSRQDALERSGASAEAVATSRPRPPGILWEVPSAPRQRPPLETIALPWLGPSAYLEVQGDHSGGSAPQPQSEVTIARLHLQLPQLGTFDAAIRVCGSAVAVSVDCAGANDLQAQLAVLQQRLQARGLVSAHVGPASQRSTS